MQCIITQLRLVHWPYSRELKRIRERRPGYGYPVVAHLYDECTLLAYFYENEGKALSRDQVMNDIWGTEYYGTQRSLDSFVANLRGKIEEEPSKPKHILTIHGVGYKFVK